MLRHASWLALPALMACNPCPAGTRSYEVPLTGTQTEKFCRSDGGTLHGPYKRFEGGRLIVDGGYEFGDRTGTWSTYDAEGRVVGLQQYADDRKAGTWKEWTSEGLLASEVAYEHDLAHGPERAWYADGQPKIKGGNVEGQRDGVWTAWYPNGQREWERNFDLGIRDGAWTEWAADGQLLVRGTYVRGERDGVWEEWYPGGQPKLRIVYEGGSPRGDAAWWDEAGNPRLPLATGEIRQVDLDASLLSERERPPEPRLAWAFRPEEQGPLGPPVEVRDHVVFAVGSHVYGLRVNAPENGWVLDAPERLVPNAPVVEGDQILLWTESGHLLVVDAVRTPGTWALHRLEADPQVEAAASDPYVLFVGRDNRVHAYDRREQRILWSRPVDGEALHVGLAPERAWVLTTTGRLVVYDVSDGAEVTRADFRTASGRPRWTSVPRAGFLLTWWSGDVLEGVRPLDGKVVWTWKAPDEVSPEDARLALVSTRFGDLGVFLGHRVWYLDTAASGELTAQGEAFAHDPPAHYSSCTSWGKVCVRADPDGRIDYPGGTPYIGTGLVAAPALGEDRLWVVTDEGWLGRLDFEPHSEVDVTLVSPGRVDEDRFLLDVPGRERTTVRKIRWMLARGAGERVGLDFGAEGLPVGQEIEARVTLPVTDEAPAWTVPWFLVGRAQHQEAWYRYRLYREVGSLALRDLPADRLDAILRCEDREKAEASGAMTLMGSTRPDGVPEFDTRLEGTFRIGSALFAKACALVVSYRQPDTDAFENLGAFGPPGRPLATTQPVRLELHGSAGTQGVGTVTDPRMPTDLLGVTSARVIQDSGFGPTRNVEVLQPRRIERDGDHWSLVDEAGTATRVFLPELALDAERHGEAGETVEVMTWRVRTAPIEPGTYHVVSLYSVGAANTDGGVASAQAPGTGASPQ